MSGKTVRTQFKNFLVVNAPTENVVDLTDEFDELNDFLSDNGISRTDDWLGIQFIGNDETPVGLSADNSTGRYRETGSFFLHVVTRVRDSVKPRDNIEPRVDTLRNLLRGQNISGIIITGVTPPNFESGATLEFEGGYQSASFIANYYFDINL